jgi:hypothetical protein
MLETTTGKVICVQSNWAMAGFSVRDGVGVVRPFMLWSDGLHADGPVALYFMHATVALTHGLDVTVAWESGSPLVKHVRLNAA